MEIETGATTVSVIELVVVAGLGVFESVTAKETAPLAAPMHAPVSGKKIAASAGRTALVAGTMVRNWTAARSRRRTLRRGQSAAYAMTRPSPIATNHARVVSHGSVPTKALASARFRSGVAVPWRISRTAVTNITAAMRSG